MSARRRLLVGNLAVGVGYYALAKLGAAVLFTGDVQVAWLPVGFAAAVLYLGDLRWLGGAAAADLLLAAVAPFDPGALVEPVNVVVTIGNTIEFTLAAVLMRQWLGPANRLDRPVDVARLLLAVAIGTAISATVGSLTEWRAGDVAASELPSVFRTWWLGDTAGGMLVAPLILVWAPGAGPWRPAREEAVAGAAILAAVVGLSVVVFGSTHPLTYLVFPALVLAAVILGQRGATLAVALAVVVAIVRTAGEHGPFVTSSIDDETLSTQLYLLVATVTTLTLGALVSAREQAAVALVASRAREAGRAAEERQRIAGDLHDSVSQTLFSLGLHAGLAKHHAGRMAAGEHEPLRQAIDEVADLAQRALLEMRASIFELRGDALAEQGLVAALRAHAAALSARGEVQVRVEGPDERLPLDDAAEERLYRMGRHAIAEAVGRPDATAVHVRVERLPREVVLAVEPGGGADLRVALAG